MMTPKRAKEQISQYLESVSDDAFGIIPRSSLEAWGSIIEFLEKKVYLLDNALLTASNELTDATAQINELNAENNLLHDALTKLQARYDETEASLFQHLREKESTLAELEAARELGSITYQLQDELNAMSLELENKVTNDGWASIAVRNGLRVFVNVNTNEVSYKIATDKKRRSFNNYQGALNFLSEIKDGE